tara:strand:- start:4041 stop:5009 length:969 start_codon:yes stop_codon:yes gene_type:complete
MTVTLDQRKQLDVLTKDNPAMYTIVDRVTSLEHIDKKCAIMFLDGETKWYHKYVIDPQSDNPNNRKLNQKLSEIVHRGLAHQYSAQTVPGVQALTSPSFIDGIPGLIGKLKYIDGQTLEHALAETEPRELQDIFTRFEKETVDGINNIGIIHADIKPENLIYKEGKLHLIDWSLARSYGEDFQEFIGPLALGTPGYFHRDIERSVDYTALAMTFAKRLLPAIRLPKAPKNNPSKIPRRNKMNESTVEIAEKLESRFGVQPAVYFERLANKEREYPVRDGMRKIISNVLGPEPEGLENNDPAEDTYVFSLSIRNSTTPITVVL